MNEAPVTQQASAATTVAPDPMTLAPGETLYTVVGGDSLSEIAEETGRTVEELRERQAFLLNEWRGYCLANARTKPGACVDVVIKGLRLVIPAADRPQ